MEMGTKVDCMNKDDSIFLLCDCNSHALFVEKFKDEEEVYVSLFERGLNGRKLSSTEKLRWCWQILRHGTPWTDFVILNKENQKSLTEFLNKK